MFMKVKGDLQDIDILVPGQSFGLFAKWLYILWSVLQRVWSAFESGDFLEVHEKGQDQISVQIVSA